MQDDSDDEQGGARQQTSSSSLRSIAAAALQSVAAAPRAEPAAPAPPLSSAEEKKRERKEAKAREKLEALKELLDGRGDGRNGVPGAFEFNLTRIGYEKPVRPEMASQVKLVSMALGRTMQEYDQPRVLAQEAVRVGRIIYYTKPEEMDTFNGVMDAFWDAFKPDPEIEEKEGDEKEEENDEKVVGTRHTFLFQRGAKTPFHTLVDKVREQWQARAIEYGQLSSVARGIEPATVEPFVFLKHDCWSLSRWLAELISNHGVQEAQQMAYLPMHATTLPLKFGRLDHYTRNTNMLRALGALTPERAASLRKQAVEIANLKRRAEPNAEERKKIKATTPFFLPAFHTVANSKPADGLMLLQSLRVSLVSFASHQKLDEDLRQRIETGWSQTKDKKARGDEKDSPARGHASVFNQNPEDPVMRKTFHAVVGVLVLPRKESRQIRAWEYLHTRARLREQMFDPEYERTRDEVRPRKKQEEDADVKEGETDAQRRSRLAADRAIREKNMADYQVRKKLHAKNREEIIAARAKAKQAQRENPLDEDGRKAWLNAFQNDKKAADKKNQELQEFLAEMKVKYNIDAAGNENPVRRFLSVKTEQVEAGEAKKTEIREMYKTLKASDENKLPSHLKAVLEERRGNVQDDTLLPSLIKVLDQESEGLSDVALLVHLKDVLKKEGESLKKHKFVVELKRALDSVGGDLKDTKHVAAWKRVLDKKAKDLKTSDLLSRLEKQGMELEEKDVVPALKAELEKQTSILKRRKLCLRLESTLEKQATFLKKKDLLPKLKEALEKDGKVLSDEKLFPHLEEVLKKDREALDEAKQRRNTIWTQLRQKYADASFWLHRDDTSPPNTVSEFVAWMAKDPSKYDEMQQLMVADAKLETLERQFEPLRDLREALHDIRRKPDFDTLEKLRKARQRKNKDVKERVKTLTEEHGLVLTADGNVSAPAMSEICVLYPRTVTEALRTMGSRINKRTTYWEDRDNKDPDVVQDHLLPDISKIKWTTRLTECPPLSTLDQTYGHFWGAHVPGMHKLCDPVLWRQLEQLEIPQATHYLCAVVISRYCPDLKEGEGFFNDFKSNTNFAEVQKKYLPKTERKARVNIDTGVDDDDGDGGAGEEKVDLDTGVAVNGGGFGGENLEPADNLGEEMDNKHGGGGGGGGGDMEDLVGAGIDLATLFTPEGTPVQQAARVERTPAQLKNWAEAFLAKNVPPPRVDGAIVPWSAENIFAAIRATPPQWTEEQINYLWNLLPYVVDRRDPAFDVLSNDLRKAMIVREGQGMLQRVKIYREAQISVDALMTLDEQRIKFAIEVASMCANIDDRAVNILRAAFSGVDTLGEEYGELWPNLMLRPDNAADDLAARRMQFKAALSRLKSDFSEDKASEQYLRERNVIPRGMSLVDRKNKILALIPGYFDASSSSSSSGFALSPPEQKAILSPDNYLFMQLANHMFSDDEYNTMVVALGRSFVIPPPYPLSVVKALVEYRNLRNKDFDLTKLGRNRGLRIETKRLTMMPNQEIGAIVPLPPGLGVQPGRSPEEEAEDALVNSFLSLENQISRPGSGSSARRGGGLGGGGGSDLSPFGELKQVMDALESPVGEKSVPIPMTPMAGPSGLMTPGPRGTFGTRQAPTGPSNVQNYRGEVVTRTVARDSKLSVSGFVSNGELGGGPMDVDEAPMTALREVTLEDLASFASPKEAMSFVRERFSTQGGFTDTKVDLDMRQAAIDYLVGQYSAETITPTIARALYECAFFLAANVFKLPFLPDGTIARPSDKWDQNELLYLINDLLKVKKGDVEEAQRKAVIIYAPNLEALLMTFVLAATEAAEKENVESDTDAVRLARVSELANKLLRSMVEYATKKGVAVPAQELDMTLTPKLTIADVDKALKQTAKEAGQLKYDPVKFVKALSEIAQRK